MASPRDLYESTAVGTDANRDDRKQVSLLVRLRHPNLNSFAEHYALNVSAGGMFVRSATPLAEGTRAQFEVQIAQGVSVLRGIGVVRWVRRAADAKGPPGMGIQFEQLEPSSRTLIQRMVDRRSKPGGLKPSSPAPDDTADVEVKELKAQHSASVASPSMPQAPAPSPPPSKVAPVPAKAPPPPTPAAEPTLQKPAPAPAPTSGPPPPARGLAFLPAPSTPPADEGPVIGIDLGTTNSCVAFMSQGRPGVLKSKEGYGTLPSILSLTQTGKLVVGHRAKDQLLLNPKQTVYGAKRLVGRIYDSATVKDVKERFHYEICAGPGGKAAVKLGNKVVTLEEIQAIILRECKEIAEGHLGRPVTRAVVTVPAYYAEGQREAVRRAGQLAGLHVSRILNEPTAAALAYGLNRQLTRKVMVYDLGGGTFDATILKVQNNSFEVLATGGDIFLGGVDFDHAIVDLFVEKFQADTELTFSGDPSALARLTDAAEKAKLALSERSTTDVHVPMLMVDAGKGRDLKFTLTRAQVDEACADLVSRTIDVVRDVLLDAKLKATDLDEVILVGGQSRMPLVREKLHQFLGKSAHAGVHADEAVALGAALLAGSVDKASGVTLIDVLPVTIGVGIPGGAFQPLLKRNTPVPTEAKVTLPHGPVHAREAEVYLFQGEDRNIAANEYLGTLQIFGVPPGKKGLPAFTVTVKLDPECHLSAVAVDPAGKELKTSLKMEYTPEELRERLNVTPEAVQAAEESKAQELKGRGGKFWGLLKKAFGR